MEVDDERRAAPPTYSEISEFFGPLEQHAEASGTLRAIDALRTAYMAFLAAYASPPVKQVDIQALLLI